MIFTQEEIGISKVPLQVNDFGGIYVPLITMKRPDLSFDEDKQAILIRELINAGVTGILPNGTTGECATQSTEEHIYTTKYAYDVANDVAKNLGRQIQFIAGAGTNNLKEGIELVQGIRDAIGHDLTFLVVTPYYNKPTPNDLRRYYKDLAATVPGCTFVLYSVKSRTGIGIDPETAFELSQDENKQFIGLKEADNDEKKLETIVRGTDPSLFHVVSGEDDWQLKVMEFYQKNHNVPGYGAIAASANLAPAVWLRQYNAFIRGNHEEAQRIQEEEIEPIKKAMFIKTNPKPLNYAFGSAVRPPLYSLEIEGPDVCREVDETVMRFKHLLGIPIEEFNPRYRSEMEFQKGYVNLTR